MIQGGSPGAGKVLTSTDGTGISTWESLPGGGDMLISTYDNDGTVGTVDNSTLLDGNTAAYHLSVDNHVSGTTNKLFTDGDNTKLDAIEALSDVTDATNVGAAGALMDTDFTGADKVMVGTGVGTYGEVGVATANTVSTIVKRDGSGNFNAGAITASLFMGNGSGLTSVIAILQQM